MPRYFFHLRDDLDVSDTEGLELASLGQARARARAQAVHMAAASITERGRLDLSHRIEVEDQSGEMLYAVAFAEVVEVIGQSAAAS